MSEPMFDPTATTTTYTPTTAHIPYSDIRDYVIVQGNGTDSLEKAVIKLMQIGWKPTGGVHVRKEVEWTHIYTQAMTKGI